MIYIECNILLSIFMISRTSPSIWSKSNFDPKGNLFTTTIYASSSAPEPYAIVRN